MNDRWCLTRALAVTVLGLLGSAGAALAAPADSAPGTPSASGPGARLGVEAVPASPEPGAKIRTPGRIEVLAAASPVAPVAAVAADAAPARIASHQLDAWIGVLPDAQVLPEGVRRETLAWSVSPMAILRSDTKLHDWKQLGGHTVCLAADGRLAGELAARFDAIEQVYPSATDALLALRTGQCDALVQDEDFLLQLLKFPEWRKFSARLAPYRHVVLERLVSADLPAARRAALERATAPERLRTLAQKQARDIAFEVYLDQSVPDCH